jgi:GR25 family glycosyltransferase involved in LPS biosynthesis
MKIQNVFINTGLVLHNNRKDNINKITNFSKNTLNANVINSILNPSNLTNIKIINDLINNNIIPKVINNPEHLGKLVKIQGNNNLFLTAEQLCNFISHMQCWKSIVEKKLPYSLIIDDDVVIDEEKIINTINNFDNNINFPEKFWLISLLNEEKPTLTNRRRYNEDLNYIHMNTPQTNKMYIISYEGAKMFLSNFFPIQNTLEKCLNRLLMINAKGFVSKKTNAIIDPFIDLKIPIQPVKKIPEIRAFYLITIERSKEKRSENIEAIKSFIKETYDKELNISGVDGGLLKQDEITDRVLEGIIEPTHHPDTDLSLKDAGKLVRMNEFTYRKPFMNSSEIGCFLSHYNIWKDILNNEIPYTIIFEDDAKLDTKIFAKELEKIMNNAPENFDIISLYKHEGQVTRKFINYNELFYLTDTKVWGTSAYIITLNAVKELMENIIPIKYPVDYSMYKYFSSKKTGYLIKERIIKPYDNISVISHI